MQGEKRRWSHVAVFALLALLFHAGVVLPLLDLLLSLKDEDYEASALDVDIWRQAVAASPEEEKTPEEQLEEYEPEEDIPEGKVVRSEPTKDRRKPDDPKYLSERDSRTDQETQSRVKLPSLSSGPQSESESTGEGEAAQTEKGGMKTEMQTVGPLPPDFEKADKGEMSAELKAPKALQDIRIAPSMQAMSSAISGSGLDHLEDVIAADATVLNTAAWDYASFFNRVKEKVERFWHPGSEYRRRDPYGNIYGFKDRITVLLVVLRADGSLKHLYIMDPSGAPFLDEEAYEAVEQAAPFLNVPQGLLDKKDGLVKFTFHFIVEVGEQPVFRMRRYQ